MRAGRLDWIIQNVPRKNCDNELWILLTLTWSLETQNLQDIPFRIHTNVPLGKHLLRVWSNKTEMCWWADRGAINISAAPRSLYNLGLQGRGSCSWSPKSGWRLLPLSFLLSFEARASVSIINHPGGVQSSPYWPSSQSSQPGELASPGGTAEKIRENQI